MNQVLVIPPGVRESLQSQHKISQREVEQAFENVQGVFAEAISPEFLVDAPIHWFVSETNKGRPLRIVFTFEGGKFHIKAASDAVQETTDIYYRLYCSNKGE